MNLELEDDEDQYTLFFKSNNFQEVIRRHVEASFYCSQK